MARSPWRVVELAGSADELHHRDTVETQRTVTLCRVRGAALVLGSTHLLECGLVRHASTFTPSLARASPGDRPRQDPLWEPDVGRSFWWLGQAWADAITALGVPGPDVHRSPPVATAWSSWVCFAGVGPGEVTVGHRKVVGMAQRRTRAGALFQCAALVSWDARRLVDVLALTERQRDEAAASLGAVAAGLGPAVRVDDIEQSLVSHLP